MRRRRGRARSDDGLERDALGAALAEAALDPPRELTLAAPGEALLRERREDLVGEGRAAAHPRDLLVVLDRAERLHQPADRHRVDTGVDERSIERVREVLLLELDPPPGEQLADCRDEPAGRLDDLEALERACAVRVAEVRVQRRCAVRLDEHRRVRAVEAREVADVRLPAEDVRRPRDEERLLEQRREPLDARHALLPTMNSSASR